MQEIIGAELAFRIRSISLALYAAAAEYAATRGIIIADTKFEFGIDADGELRLMDEVLTADSSRFWPAEQYVEGVAAVVRQAVRTRLARDAALEQIAATAALPPTSLPKTAAKYREALSRLTGKVVR